MRLLYANESSQLRNIAAAVGLIHDVGYGAPDTGHHAIDGARIVSRTSLAPLAPLVAWHSTAKYEAQERGMVIDVPYPHDSLMAARLWVADFSTTPQGEKTTPEQRMGEIRLRYPSGSPVISALDASLEDFKRAREVSVGTSPW